MVTIGYIIFILIPMIGIFLSINIVLLPISWIKICFDFSKNYLKLHLRKPIIKNKYSYLVINISLWIFGGIFYLIYVIFINDCK